MSDLYNPGHRVDVLVLGAEVIAHGATTIQFTIPGVPDRSFSLPLRDQRAREVVEVTTAVPRPVAGELYVVARDAARRLFAYTDGDRVALLDPSDGRGYWPIEAVAKFGPLHLSVPMPPPVLGADRPILSATPEPVS